MPRQLISGFGSPFKRGPVSGWFERSSFGPELLRNGNFHSDALFWTGYNYQGGGVALSSDAGRLKVENDGLGGNAVGYQSIDTIIGESYFVSFLSEKGNVSSPKVAIRNALPAGSIVEGVFPTDGQHDLTFTATAASTLVILQINAIGANLHTFFDRVSARRIL